MIHIKIFMTGAVMNYKQKGENMDISEIINQLRPCSFSYNDLTGQKTGKISFGLIAQDVLQLFPNDKYTIVSNQEKGYAINYWELIPFLILQVQKQNKEIQALNEVVQTLATEIQQLKDKKKRTTKKKAEEKGLEK